MHRVADPVALDILGQPAKESDRSLKQALAQAFHLRLLKQEFSSDSGVILADGIERVESRRSRR